MEDGPKHQGRRRQLAEQLEGKGIHDERVLDAIRKIPRHLFLDSSFEDFAYQDTAFPIAAGQTISQPFTVAFQTQALQLQPTDKVLEIGTGSGYQTAVLCELGVKVFSIERQHELFLFSSSMLKKLNYNYVGKFGDGYQGLPTYAPFDKIIVTAGAKQVPPALLRQLVVGGKMIIPVGVGSQKMLSIVKVSEKDYQVKKLGDFRFVPMLEEKE
ncbi:MAG: protein-L-isoaspartate(D-aspartate) O-methyltransferase [Flavobacteriales bacterium]|nr:MAG: protein-L-isoaspartate(D-aspartate) O-methyltransferase [Flavobacteriales bacterium]